MFPTVVRYLGVLLLMALGTKAIFLGGLEYPSLIIAASGMILYKTIKGTNGNGNGI